MNFGVDYFTCLCTKIKEVIHKILFILEKVYKCGKIWVGRILKAQIKKLREWGSRL